jgi:uncharacterized membrane protein
VADGDAVIRGAVRLAIVGAGIGYALDRILAEQAGDRDPDPISSMVVVDAPIERVWDVLADLERQPLWMEEMKAIRIPEGEPIGVGLVCEADVRIFGITVTDPVRITEFEPPHRYAISHDGMFRGSGTITLEAGPDGTTTIVRWDEVLIPPIFAHLGALAMTPVLGAIFQSDLARFKEMVERETADRAAAAGEPAKPARKPRARAKPKAAPASG